MLGRGRRGACVLSAARRRAALAGCVGDLVWSARFRRAATAGFGSASRCRVPRPRRRRRSGRRHRGTNGAGVADLGLAHQRLVGGLGIDAPGLRGSVREVRRDAAGRSVGRRPDRRRSGAATARRVVVASPSLSASSRRVVAVVALPAHPARCPCGDADRQRRTRRRRRCASPPSAVSERAVVSAGVVARWSRPGVRCPAAPRGATGLGVRVVHECIPFSCAHPEGRAPPSRRQREHLAPFAVVVDPLVCTKHPHVEGVDVGVSSRASSLGRRPVRLWRVRRSGDARWRSGCRSRISGRTSSALRFPLRSRSSGSDAASSRRHASDGVAGVSSELQSSHVHDVTTSCSDPSECGRSAATSHVETVGQRAVSGHAARRRAGTEHVEVWRDRRRARRRRIRRSTRRRSAGRGRS